MTAVDTPEAPFAYVFEQEVRTDAVDRFYALSEELHALVREHPGFIDRQFSAVEDGPVVSRFRTILTFESAESCMAWLDNAERRRLLRMEEEHAGFQFTAHGNWDGYARWLSRGVAGESPKWKVNLLVLLALYPTVLALTPLLNILLKGANFPAIMLVSNALCVAATSWIIVPALSRLYTPWLENRLTKLQSVAALGSIAIAVALIWGLFNLFWSRL